MSSDSEKEDKYEELLQIARDQMSTLEKTTEYLKRIQKELERLRRR